MLRVFGKGDFLWLVEVGVGRSWGVWHLGLRNGHLSATFAHLDLVLGGVRHYFAFTTFAITEEPAHDVPPVEMVQTLLTEYKRAWSNSSGVRYEAVSYLNGLSILGH